jgi:hypothetical protein
MRTRRKLILEDRSRLKAEYGELFDSVSAILYRVDPVGIAFDNPNLDEYAPEVGTILPRLRSCQSADDVSQIVYEEFVRWFNADNAGSQDHYRQIAREIWQLWQARLSASL